MPSSEVVAVAGAVAAWLAAIFTLMYARTTRAELRLLREQERRREPLLEIYLVESYAYRKKSESRRILAVQLLVRNPTDNDNALAALDLRVAYTVPASSELHLRLGHDANLGRAVAGVRPFEIPQHLKAHGAVQGWGLFELPDALVGGADINDYQVVISDSHGIASTAGASIFRELVDGGEAEEH